MPKAPTRKFATRSQDQPADQSNEPDDLRKRKEGKLDMQPRAGLVITLGPLTHAPALMRFRIHKKNFPTWNIV